MIAALFVDPTGTYSEVDGIDIWDEARDARNYRGPYPVIAHPPCQRWGKFWHGSTAKPHQFNLGEDGGCFASALASVRNHRGVIEHPAHSKAWRYFGLSTPPIEGGWVPADLYGGMTCHVEQGHYGHMSRKATWLYAVGVPLPSLRWGEMAMVGGKDKTKIRNATPPEFRDVLLSMCR